MPLLSIVLTLVVVGILLWALNTYGSQIIDVKILKLINIVVIIVVVIWLLRVFGVWSYMSGMRI